MPDGTGLLLCSLQLGCHLLIRQAQLLLRLSMGLMQPTRHLLLNLEVLLLGVQPSALHLKVSVEVRSSQVQLLCLLFLLRHLSPAVLRHCIRTCPLKWPC